MNIISFVLVFCAIVLPFVDAANSIGFATAANVSTNPPDVSTTLRFLFTDKNLATIRADLLVNGALKNINFNRENSNIAHEKITPTDKRPTNGSAEVYSYKLSGIDEKCVNRSIVLLIQQNLPDPNFYSMGIFAFGSAAKDYFLIGDDGPIACIIDNQDLETLITITNESDVYRKLISFNLSDDDVTAICSELDSQWGKFKVSLRTLFAPVEGRPNELYWDKDVTTGTSKVVGIVTANFLSPLVAVVYAGYLGGWSIEGLIGEITDFSVEYKLTKGGEDTFNAMTTAVKEMKEKIAMLDENFDSDDWPCNQELKKFKWLSSNENESYTSLSEFSSHIDQLFTQMKDFMEIVTTPIDTDPDDNLCEEIKGGFIDQALYQAFCAIVLFVKRGVDVMYDSALFWLNASIGIDTTQETVPK